MSYVEDKVHRQFIHTYRLAAEAYNLAHYDQARWILLQLIGALDKYPKLYDFRKRDTLLSMASILEALGHQWESEHVLWNIPDLHDRPLATASDNNFDLAEPSDDDIYLADSLVKTSKSIELLLAKIWTKTSTEAASADLALPPLHRAAENSKIGVITALLRQLNPVVSISERPNCYNLIDLAALSEVSDTIIPDQIRDVTDSRDFCNRTSIRCCC